jgi:hypothetical protein
MPMATPNTLIAVIRAFTNTLSNFSGLIITNV